MSTRGIGLVVHPSSVVQGRIPFRISWGLAILLGASGCFRSHGIDDEVIIDPLDPEDAASGFDGSPSDLDGSVPFDADPEFDAGEDAGLDAVIILPDAAPPDPIPPDPTTCRIEPTIHPFDDPVLEYRWPSAEGIAVHAASVHVCSTPLVIDLARNTDDIEPVLAFVSYEGGRGEEPPGVLRIVNPRTNTTISYPSDGTMDGVLEATTNLAAGNIDSDAQNEIIGIGWRNGTYAFDHDGTVKWHSSYPTVEDRGDQYNPVMGGAPALADLDADGDVEVIVGRNVLDGATGTLVWRGSPTAGGFATNQFFGPLSCVADLDSDGRQEVIAGNVAYRSDGTILWTSDSPDGMCGVADIDSTLAGPEVVLVSVGYVRILNGQTGAATWIRRLEGRVRLSVGGVPTISDFDGDGDLEIGVAHGAAYGVYDPDCQGAGRPAGCVGEGLLWQASTSDASSSGTGSAVFDFNGDGRAEVVYNDEYYFRIYDGITGGALFEHRNSSRTRTENPTIADVDNDGDAEIIFSANAEAFFLREGWTDPGVEIWGDARGRWVGARRIWNQHSYHITNVNEDGTIPQHEATSWTVHNTYRQNLREGVDVLVVPDLWGGHGEYECIGRGRAVLRVNVQNYGLERVGAGVVVAFYRGSPDDGDRIGEVMTTRTLEPGDSEVVEIEAELMNPVTDYWGVLDNPEEPEGGAVQECREGNNEVLFWRPECR